MIRLSEEIFLVLILLSVFGKCLNYQKTYTAAVVDYIVEYSDYPKERLPKNVEKYLGHMRNASRKFADIIVFPEYGLVDVYTMYEVIAQNVSNLDEYSTFVPNPQINKTAPCDDKQVLNYSLHLINISCAARIHGMYTVINVLEKDHDNETDGGLVYYNTNVVMDRLGTVIARYRKINLSEKRFLIPGDHLVTFDTDFEVTFGIFTCSDILFRNPAIDILTIPEVTDIIFPTSWESETPFLQALSIQHGYAKSNGVNMLASCLGDSSYQGGGSGIYLADGSILESRISSNKKQTKLLIQEVPIIKKRIPPLCDGVTLKKNISQPSKPLLKSDEANSFRATHEDMTGYAFEPLSKSSTTQKRVCSEDKEFCCYFNIILDSSLGASKESRNYNYKLAVFNGFRSFSNDRVAGVQTCSLLACPNERGSSCGEMTTNSTFSTTIFKSIYIKAVVDKTGNSYYQPSTLRINDLRPTSGYVYCTQEVAPSGKIKIIMSSIEPIGSLLTFGIYGRIYDVDTIVIKTPFSTLAPLNDTLIMMILCCSIAIFICSGAVLWKCCTKKE